MADLLKSAKASNSALVAGQRVKGKVVGINKSSLILDIGAKSEGIVAEKAFVQARDYISGLKVGDEITATVIFPETRDGSILLSLRDLVHDKNWSRFEKSLKDKSVETVKVINVGQAGLTVETDGVQGFVPGSQLGSKTSLGTISTGAMLKVKVIEIDRSRNKIVFSEKQVSDAYDLEKMNEASKKLKIGQVYKGLVTTVTNFGCFVAIEVGKQKIEGLVHLSEMSWGKTEKPFESTQKGDEVSVKVLSVGDGKLALSIKQAGDDPWLQAEKKYKVGSSLVQGTATKKTDFGYFIELEPGIEGLLHITKIPPTQKINVGEKIDCFVEDVDTKNRKISLGLILTKVPLGYK